MDSCIGVTSLDPKLRGGAEPACQARQRNYLTSTYLAGVRTCLTHSGAGGGRRREGRVQGHSCPGIVPH